jgi:phospholipid transport system substrate-binding protein
MNKWMTGAVSLLLSCASWATTPATATAPDEVVKKTTAELQQMIRDNLTAYKADLPRFYADVDALVTPNFDLPYIARSVLARNWKTATPEQRTRFTMAFKDMIIRSYANAMLDYHDNVEPEWEPLRMAEGATQTAVHSLVKQTDGAPINVSFQMHLSGGAWKIYDIAIENISVVQNFRSQFYPQVKSKGLDAVIAKMESGELKPATPDPVAPTTPKAGS